MNKILAFTAGLILVFSSCSEKKSEQLPNNFKENRDKFITTIETFQESNKISAELPNYTTDEQSSQEQKMKTLIHKGIETSNEISDAFLNFLHPDLSDNFRNKLVKSNELYLDGAFSKSDDPTTSFQKQLQANQLLSEWGNYWEKNFDQIDKNLNTKASVDKTKKSYWRMLLRFIISDFVSILVFSFFVIALLLPLAPIGLLAEKINKGLVTIISIPFMIIAGVGQAYFWILWAAYCAFTIRFYMDSPTVSHNWLYYITGFFAVTAPIGWLSSKEKQSATSYEEQKKIQGGTFYYSLIAAVAFIVFCIWTNLLDYKYISWLNDWLY